jgi:hypothetical protein
LPAAYRYCEPRLTARKLMIEFIGGEPGEMLRDQFAV